MTVGCIGANGDAPNALIALSAATSGSASFATPALALQSYSCSVAVSGTPTGFAPRAIFTLRAGSAVSMNLEFNDMNSKLPAAVLVYEAQHSLLLRVSDAYVGPLIQGTVSMSCGPQTAFVFTFDGSGSISRSVDVILPIGSTCHWSGTSIVGLSLTLPPIPIPSTLSFGSGYSGTNTLTAAVLNVSDPNLPQTLLLQLATALPSSDSISLQLSCSSTLVPPSPNQALVAAVAVPGGAISGSSTGFVQQAGVPVAQVYNCQMSTSAIIAGSTIIVARLAQFSAVTLPVVGVFPASPCSIYDPSNMDGWNAMPITVSQPFPLGFTDSIASPRGGMSVTLALRGTAIADSTPLGAFSISATMGMGSAGLNQTGFYVWPAGFGVQGSQGQVMLISAKSSITVAPSASTGPIWSRVAGTYTNSIVMKIARDNRVSAPATVGFTFTRTTSPGMRFNGRTYRNQGGVTYSMTVPGASTDNGYSSAAATIQFTANVGSGSQTTYSIAAVSESPYGADFIQRAQHTFLLPSTINVVGRIVSATGAN